MSSSSQKISPNQDPYHLFREALKQNEKEYLKDFWEPSDRLAIFRWEIQCEYSKGNPDPDYGLKLGFDNILKESPYWRERYEIEKKAKDEECESISKIFKDKQNAILKLLSELKSPQNANNTVPELAASLLNALTSSRPLTYIIINYDAGHGNFLSICGTGPKMSWDPEKAVRLRCVGNDTWVYETTESFKEFNYKILLNNKKWENGSDHCVKFNSIRPEVHRISPSFS